jgi:hypothetical protein
MIALAVVLVEVAVLTVLVEVAVLTVLVEVAVLTVLVEVIAVVVVVVMVVMVVMVVVVVVVDKGAFAWRVVAQRQASLAHVNLSIALYNYRGEFGITVPGLAQAPG